MVRSFLLLFLLLLLCTTKGTAVLPLGTEFTLRPISSGICDIVKLSEGIWLDGNNNPVPIDSDGYPLGDAYLIVFVEQAVPQDPEDFIPSSVFGRYLVKFDGQAQSITTGPTINATITDVQFNSTTYSTTFVFTLFPTLSPSSDILTGMAIGFFGTTRNTSGAPGITNVHIYPPACWETNSTSPFPALPNQLFHPSLLTALLPFSQIRMMEWMQTNYNYTYTEDNELQWYSRSLMSDGLWTNPNYIRDGSFSPPWETVILLYQELIRTHQQQQKQSPKSILPSIHPSLWLNIPVSASSDYIQQWLLLLVNGNEYTNNTGLPFSIHNNEGNMYTSQSTEFYLYLELGNELWLNGTEGGPGTNYLYNLQAATAEVAKGGSNLNNDGNTDPQVWGQRRHLRQIYQISQIIQQTFPSNPTILTTQIRLLYGTFQEYSNDIFLTFTWFIATYPDVPLSSFLFGVCVNSYLISYFPAGTTIEEMYTAWLMNSDNEVEPRINLRNVLNQFNVQGLVSYEGSPVGIAANNDNPTNSFIIEANRFGPIGDVISYDILNNWYHHNLINGTAYNIYALSSKYAPPPVFQWGILEDLNNLTTAKYTAVLNLVNNEK